jgi:hypothetical protein
MRSKTLRLKRSRKFKKSNRRSRSKRVKRSKKSSRVKGIKRSSRVKGPKRSKRVKRSKMSARSRKRIRGKKRSQRGGMDAAEWRARREAGSLFDGAGEATEATMAALTAARGKSVEAGKKMEEELKVAYFKDRPPEHLELHNKALEMENGLPKEDWPDSDNMLDLDIRLWLGVQPYLTSGAPESLSEDDDDDDDVPFDLDLREL